MAKEKIPVAAFDFKYPKYFAPFPKNESEQKYYFFEAGDKLPDDVLERLLRFNPEMVYYLSKEEVKSVKNKILEERGLPVSTDSSTPKIEETPLSVKKTLKDYPEAKTKELFSLSRAKQRERLKKLGLSDEEILLLKEESERILKILELEENLNG